MKRGMILIGIFAAALAVGCEENTPAAGGDVAIADADLAVPADFADEAEKSITAANYKSELDSLEKEIDAPQQ
ncbi:MAG: hypothetical protein HUU21_32445 [Polyangiaceae bacterium]|nr:hypothetical protein [Polyangiaceae bacterium]NUQ78263.1 hypothetical protein [Polyangiaceae bacterium]